MIRLIGLLVRTGSWDRAFLGAILARLAETLVSLVPYGVLMIIIAAALGAPSGMPGLFASPLEGQGPLWLTGVLVAAYGGRWALVRLATDLGQRAGYTMTARLRLAVAEHLMTLPGAFFQGKDSGRLTHVFMSDVTQIEQFPGLILPRLVSLVGLSLAAVVAALWADWRLGLVLGATIALGIGGLAVGERFQEKATAARAEAMATLNSRTLEFLSGIHVIRSFGLGARRSLRLGEAIEGARKTSKALTARYVVAAILVPLIVAVGCAMVISLAILFLSLGWMDPFGFLFFVFVCLRLTDPIRDLVDFSSILQQMVGSAGRLLDLLATPVEAEGTSPAPSDRTVRFEEVGFAHGGEAPILDGLSFVLAPGTITALVGGTGAGKTTALRLLSRHWTPTKGRVTVGGVDLSSLSRHAFSNLVGIVSQTVVLFSLSARDNIRLVRPQATDAEVERAARAARCDGFIKAMPQGYDTLLVNAGATLSGGERQRLALARLFLRDCPILLFDEATSALDVENEHLVQEAMSELVRGRTVLVVAHRLWTIKGADQILVLDQGRIIERGDHDALIAAEGFYHQSWVALEQAPGWCGRDAKAPA
ncbi:ABC transporter ATP-binding protein [Rhodospirillum rubrum]|uniref:ABC transporter, transmembrane region n=1 Tax=Rhodospirillum rubrum (strain ATCC 11170 / ATH 1.1.1 / DSM 467 / LMG 4362 / NCIMB 8255 / S1) TaxID=269796 RepID=Q2RW12_RHORT|nr:ABC transporter ATP-binding protein [Rhodospirillum rubrum]ABC21683.1 ABC transporter, transmembrane region [Rhodospirillum rubrum ATCC 11170]AEO47381.1 ABC transporter transmembrane region [Rhodospirillum rubrum F11]MBK5953235.1 ABC transporter ATP-binding protein [Rhodospirillum rubrum]QXG81346.1 ABC transporter ATP-binding protein/permease [Rhodospirillum rubrum]HAQ01455.1 ABC transporter ATP-binding protein [Rhodospirillum rubrum]